MSRKTTSTRRSFLKSSALLAAPLAVGATPVIAADNGLKERVLRLEDEARIRELHQSWLRQVNTGAMDASRLFADLKDAAFHQRVRSIAADHTGEPDAIKISSDNKSAVGQYHSTVEFATAIAQDSTLAQMAHAQGGGFIQSTERRVLNVKYVKTNDTWRIASIDLSGPVEV